MVYYWISEMDRFQLFGFNCDDKQAWYVDWCKGMYSSSESPHQGRTNRSIVTAWDCAAYTYFSPISTASFSFSSLFISATVEPSVQRDHQTDRSKIQNPESKFQEIQIPRNPNSRIQISESKNLKTRKPSTFLIPKLP